MPSKKKRIIVNITRWPEFKLPWKTVRAEALKKGVRVGDYVAQAIEQRIKQGW